MKPAELAARIDHTILKPEATPEDVDRLVREALEHNFASVCVNGRFVERVASALDQARRAKPHPVLACAVAGFPLGAMTPMAMAIEATQAAKHGAREIDVVAWIPHLVRTNADALRDDLLHTTRAVRAVAPSIVVKVILETGALRATAPDDAAFEAMIATGCDAARSSGCDFVKTSTGFHPAGGATIEAVRLMRKHADNTLKVKASGGVRTREDALRMIDAGADRIGASSSVAIINSH
ncbi:MAG: deoxyribose-phosphate aldolase [Phycisphaerales bacterium]|nr:MAG: deoxyribose-phosphate aldolase [Phycisphaerales bacterium]